MTDFLERLKQRKLVQWALAYLAAAWALLQVLDMVGQRFAWSDGWMRGIVVAAGIGFFVVLLLAWYHGERGMQRVSATELLILAVLLAVGGGLLWQLGRNGSNPMPPPGSVPVTNARGAATGAMPGASTGASLRASAGASAGATASPGAVPGLPAAQAIPAKSIAVLPFENLSDDKSNAYFADGMQDLILTKLAAIGDLKVISRTSTMKYASHPDDLKTIARQLGVATVLEGSVQKAGNQVLINLQLIDARTDSHLWANSYTRTLENIFGVEGEVAQKVADALAAKLTKAQVDAVAAVPTRNPQAFDAYLRGEGYMADAVKGMFQSAIPKAVDAYQHAVEQDPQFALAWAKLAFAQGALMYASIDTSDATRQQALANARHALALAPNLPQAHLALGYVYRFDFADYSKALSEFEIARTGLPNNADVESAIAWVKSIQGDADAAVADLQRAMALDPRNPNLAHGLGMQLMDLHQYDRASVAFQRMLALAKDDPEAYADMAWLKVRQSGDTTAALAQLDAAPTTAQTDPVIVRMRVRILLLQGDVANARLAVDGLQPGGRFVTPANVALLRGKVSWLSGDHAGARKFFEQALTLANAVVARGGEPAVQGLHDVALAEAGLGHKTEVLRAIAKVHAILQEEGAQRDMFPPFEMATIHLMLGDKDDAVATLGKALDGPLHDAAFVRLQLRGRIWDPLRTNPRFQAWVKKYDKAAKARQAAS